MRVDAHQHFWRFDPVRDRWITSEMSILKRDFLPSEIEALLAHHEMDGSVAVQANQSEDETRFLLELADRHPSVLGVVGWVDLQAPNLPERLQHWSAFPRLRGFRHIAQTEPDDFLGREEVVRGIGMLEEFGMTYDVLVYPRQLPAVLSLVSRLPDQPLVVDHMAKPLVADGILEPWASQMRELATCPNLWCKVSGLVTEADWAGWRPRDLHPYLDVVFDTFGPERLMFGSDWPVCLLAAEYGEVMEIVDEYARGLTKEEREGFFGGNAAAFYGLGG